MFEHRVFWNSVSDDHSAVVGDDGSGCETRAPRSWQRWVRDPKQAVLDPAGDYLHDIFFNPLELNSVETEVTASESPWQAGITEANGRAFKNAAGRQKEYMKNVLTQQCWTEAFCGEPQHVFGRDPELSFDVLVPGADVAAVTMPVLDRPSERAVQIRQAAAFVESQDDKPMRRALVARPCPSREFKS